MLQHYDMRPGHSAGATLGQAEVASIRAALGASSTPVTVVLLDFSAVESATGSYLKATVLALVQSAQVALAGAGLAKVSDPSNFDVYPVAYRLNNEVREELELVMYRHGLPLLEAVEVNNNQITRARILGTLDRPLHETLQIVLRHGEVTAGLLSAHHPSERISTTGWNNRLADLHRYRLVQRTKEGRQWIYRAITKEIVDG